MVKYIKCPRCELNYIDSEQQEYCDVCLAELKGAKLKFADIDEELEHLELCPVCNTNYMKLGEKLCEVCKKASKYETDDNIDIDNDDEWRNYLDDNEDDLSDIPAGEIDEEEEEEEEEYEVEKIKDDDEFDFPTSTEYSYADDEDDEDDEDEEDEDDF